MTGREFIHWKQNVDLQAEAYFRDRAGTPQMDAERKFYLTPDDRIFLGAIEGAFRDVRPERFPR